MLAVTEITLVCDALAGEYPHNFVRIHLRNHTKVTATDEPLHTLAFCRKLEPRSGPFMSCLWRRLWGQDEGQDVAEYAVMLAVVLVITIGTIQLIGSNANSVFSSLGSALQ